MVASKELELALTTRDRGKPEDERTPMCGVPYHSCEAYIGRLIAKGYKVAICDQTEDPAQAKGLVKRDVVRIVTPGTLTEMSMLPDAGNNFLASVYAGQGEAGLALADVSTGEVYATVTALTAAALADELARFSCSELIVDPDCPPQLVSELEKTVSLRAGFGLREDYTPQAAEECLNTHFLQFPAPEGYDAAKLALCAAVGYIFDVYKGKIVLNGRLEWYSTDRYLSLDVNARRNLELYTTMRRNERRGSLLWVLDRTKTAMGRRLLTEFVQRPLLDCARILKRQNAVAELYAADVLCGELADLMEGIHDIERIATRICCETANARELNSLALSLAPLPALQQKTAGFAGGLLKDIHRRLDPLEDIASLIRAAISDEPPLTITEGDIIADGYNAEVDRLRNVMKNSQQMLLDFEAQEREKTGIRQLRVKYSRVFGYGIEISKSQADQVPDHYIRRQTLTNGERYVTEELKNLENDIAQGKTKLLALEYQLFCEVRKKVSEAAERLRNTAKAVAELDAFVSLATVALRNHYCRPEVDTGSTLSIVGGRHPVVELTGEGAFVPNDVSLDNGENQILLITGPNMAGKSTYMRQTALIVIMAQMGGFVPADSAHIGIVDAVFTRVGASDDLAAGQSTFMVEMTELAHILKKATAKSLIILDEIGRGTSTFDGMSIAQATVEYIADRRKVGAKTLFATHYHELCRLETALECVKNYNILVRKRGDEIQFLRRIARGGADQSYGIEVSKLAGVPDAVIRRAKVILAELESGEQRRVYADREQTLQFGDGSVQSGFDDDKRAALIQRLQNTDANTLTPLEAITLLAELSALANEL